MEVKLWQYDEFPDFNDVPEGVEVLRTTGDEPGVMYMNDVEYANIGGVPLRLQLLLPYSRNKGFDPFAGEQAEKRPCYVFVQGSAWMKQHIYGNVPALSRLARRGYVCAIVEYRHSDIAYFPAQVNDARNAVRFLKKNAAKYGIDPDRMILAGDSSGGHTAVWGGIHHNDESGQNLFPGISGEVAGIVDYYGCTTMMIPDSNPITVDHCLPDSPEGKVMGGRNLLAHPELAKALSAECNIDEKTKIAPVLILHGTKDRIVNCKCSVILYERLKQTGHDATLYLLRGADHGGAEFWTDEIIGIVDRFCRHCFLK